MKRCSFAIQFSSVQSLSCVLLFATPWIAAPRIAGRQASLSITNSRSLLKLMSVESVMPSSHLIFCHPLLLLPPIPPSIRVFSSESTFRMRWPKYWSFSFSISPSNEHSGPIFLKVKVKSLSRVQLFATPWTVAYQGPPSMGFPGKNTGVGCHFLLQGIFPTEGSNQGLLHCRQAL